MSYRKVIVLRLIPLYLFDLLLLFFLIYQTMIGNRFLEDIHPSIILGGFLVFSVISTYFLSTFTFKVVNGEVVIRMGFFREKFNLSDIRGIEIEEDYNPTYGVSVDKTRIVFKLNRSKGLKFKLDNKEVVVYDRKFLKKYNQGKIKFLGNVN
ncbi:MAG: hypothetical protein RMJ37_07460 [Spirochaetia bacterium]|nr:hypothetical protein [Spirochaetota bacterium]MCX8096474.1 hypothetical protein [Spirochaetota bacterium]MDW8113150.1 hypothetical protein [Spirochaetia bacterium]